MLWSCSSLGSDHSESGLETSPLQIKPLRSVKGTYSRSLFFPPPLIFLWAPLLLGQGILVSLGIWNSSPRIALDYKAGSVLFNYTKLRPN